MTGEDYVARLDRLARWARGTKYVMCAGALGLLACAWFGWHRTMFLAYAVMVAAVGADYVATRSMFRAIRERLEELERIGKALNDGVP